MKNPHQEIQIVCGNLKIYGCQDDDQVRAHIGRVFVNIPESEFETLWYERQILFFISLPGSGGSVEDLALDSFDLSERVCIVTARFDKTIEDFQDTISHELAHVFYKDGTAEELIGISNLQHAAMELRADFKSESWGFLKDRDESYLYGHLWDFFDKSGVDKDEAIKIAKILPSHPQT